MQTFLPYSSFYLSAKCLDYKRLGNQRNEAISILYINYRKLGADMRGFFNRTDEQAEWIWKRYQNHPAVLMWEGYEDALELYYNEILREWIDRGYNNTMRKIGSNPVKKWNYPWWLGNEEFHSKHRANLLRKNYNFYSQYDWGENPADEYYWPVRKQQ
jgi:Pyrimidine dimer DNA glycosylase